MKKKRKEAAVFTPTHALSQTPQYYRLIEQLGACMEAGSDSVPANLMLRWDDEKAETFTLVDNTFYSASDQRSLALCGVIGAVGHILCDCERRKNHTVLVSQAAINREKKLKKSKETKYLSSNDILTAAVAGALQVDTIVEIAM